MFKYNVGEFDEDELERWDVYDQLREDDLRTTVLRWMIDTAPGLPE